jgi:hypothetical protein
MSDFNFDQFNGVGVGVGADATSELGMCQIPGIDSYRTKKKIEKKALKAERNAFAEILYETNHITGKNIHEHFSEFDFSNVVLDSNVDAFKRNYALSNNQILRIWNKHSGRGNIANCMHCGIRKISVPYMISNMTGNRHYIDDKNHNINASSFLPNAFLVFRSSEQKIVIDTAMEEIKSRSGTVEEAKAIWTGIKKDHYFGVDDIIGIVCYHCYNFNLEHGSYCLDIAKTEDNSYISGEVYVEHTYNYLIPFLIVKNRCIYNEKGMFCCNKVLSRESLTHCRPENLERVTNLISGKETIIQQKMVGYTDHMDLFVCGKHKAMFGSVP